MNEQKGPEKNGQCPGCSGSGQVSYFKGESRFLLTMEECPECLGTGILLRRSKKVLYHDKSDPEKKQNKKESI